LEKHDISRPYERPKQPGSEIVTSRGDLRKTGVLHMLNFYLNLTKAHKKSLIDKSRKAQAMGDIREAKRLMAILALADEQDMQATASILQITVEAIRGWVKQYLVHGLQGLASKKPPGRRSKLTKSHKKELAGLIEDGPEKSGFIGNCWRSPMIQELIHERFNVYCIPSTTPASY
jgi:transposase